MNLGRINLMCKKICKYFYMTRLSDLSLHMPRQGPVSVEHGAFFEGLNSSSALRFYVGFIENRLPKALEWSQIILCNLWLWGCNCNLQIFLCVYMVLMNHELRAPLWIHRTLLTTSCTAGPSEVFLAALIATSPRAQRSWRSPHL